MPMLNGYDLSISVTMMSRLMLNLHEVATPPSTLDSTGSRSTQSVSMVFTTRLDSVFYVEEVFVATSTMSSTDSRSHGTMTGQDGSAVQRFTSSVPTAQESRRSPRGSSTPEEYALQDLRTVEVR